MLLATLSRRLTAADADRPAPAVRWRAPFAPTPCALQATESDPGKSVIAARGSRMSVGGRFGGLALAALVAAGALPGCTVTEPAVPGVVAVSLNPADKAPPSDDALNGEVLYKLLVGELASHRGDMLVALENYLDVARETRDAGVAARATKLAMFAHAEERGLEAARFAVDRAFRQYDATDPANRLVAAELEARWNAALTGVAGIEAKIAEHDATAPPSRSTARHPTALSPGST